MRRWQDQHGLQGVQNQYERVRGQGSYGTPAEPAETAPEKSTGGAGLIVVVLLLLLGGGGALYWFKLRKPKADTRGADDLDDYDYGEDEEDEDYEFEDENTADSEEDKNQ